MNMPLEELKDRLELHKKWRGGAGGERLILNDIGFHGLELNHLSFSEAKLSGVNFNDTIIKNCLFINSKLNNVRFEDASIRGVNFSRATLMDVNFIGSKQYGVDFSNADLINVDFTRATLQKIDFTRALLNKVDFEHCQNIVTFCFGAHLAVFQKDTAKLTIGMFTKPIDEWLNRNQDLFNDILFGYTNEQIEQYGSVIKLLASQYVGSGE